MILKNKRLEKNDLAALLWVLFKRFTLPNIIFIHPPLLLLIAMHLYNCHNQLPKITSLWAVLPWMKSSKGTRPIPFPLPISGVGNPFPTIISLINPLTRFPHIKLKPCRPTTSQWWAATHSNLMSRPIPRCIQCCTRPPPQLLMMLPCLRLPFILIIL